ncbi:hypothetical protein [Microterricola viridarii]|uniref:Uncharacterized protein n=1 Tax=Microterricola viridarii TaxID=412690 RepID=A0A1H1Y6E3_9MICO|nr:hypothetical protein [Microterricola viridarii]SDT16971.1 hypothetical protein SAMN04489834_2990 [Microterricola viridarii]
MIGEALAAETPVVTTTDIVPLAATDERGVGFAASAFPSSWAE